jgi:hypothetical protein
MTDEEASAYAELHNIGADTTADAQLVGEASGALAEAEADVDAEGEPEKEPTPPPKTPKAKAARKPKAGKNTPAESSVPAPAATTGAIKPPVTEPAKKETPATGGKRKRAGKKADEPAEAEELAVETPKSAPKQPRKKKAKGDA